MAKRYFRRHRVCDVNRKGLTVLYSTDPASRPPRNEDRRPVRTLPIHLYRRPSNRQRSSYSRKDGETCVKERHIPGRHLIQVHRRIVRQTNSIMEELQRLHEAIQHLQLDAIEMDWDYSPTTASLCYVAQDFSQVSGGPFHGPYPGAWGGRDSPDGDDGSDFMGCAMEICEEGEVSSSQDEFSETY